VAERFEADPSWPGYAGRTAFTFAVLVPFDHFAHRRRRDPVFRAEPEPRDPETWPYPLDHWEDAGKGLRNVRMPVVEGESNPNVEVVRWLVRVGDPVGRLTPLAHVLMDVATVEIHSPLDGVVRELRVPEGGALTFGAPLCTLAPPPSGWA